MRFASDESVGKDTIEWILYFSSNSVHVNICIELMYVIGIPVYLC